VSGGGGVWGMGGGAYVKKKVFHVGHHEEREGQRHFSESPAET